MAVQKTLWHSELVQLGNVDITVKTNPQKSKYKDKPDYVTITLDGNDRHYQIENPTCGQFFQGRAGQRLLIQARDSRENASIHLMGPPAAGQPAQTPPAAPPQQSAPAQTAPVQPANTAPAAATPPAQTAPPMARKTPEQIAADRFVNEKRAVTSAREMAARKLNGFHIAMKAVDHLAEVRSKEGRAMTPEQFQGTVTSIFISMDRAGVVDALPVGDLDKFLPAPKEDAK